MASLSRTTTLRQSQRLSSTRLFTAQPMRAFRPVPSLLPKQLQAPKFAAASRFAPFTTTARRDILPLGPQVIQGDVNDAAPVPKPEPLHGSYHWTFERLLSVGLVPLTITPFAAGSLNPILDATLIFALIVHSHIGFQSMIIDYIPIKTYPIMRKAFNWLLNIATVVVGIGFYEFETNDVGVTEAIKRIWHA